TKIKKVSSIDAQKVIDDLEAKKAELAAARANDEAGMEAAAYAAHTGDHKAQAKLETLRERALRRDLELKNLESAIAEAWRRLAEAQDAEAKAEQRRVALEVRGLIGSLRDAGKVADEALQTFADASNAMAEIIKRMNTLGYSHPSAMQLQSLGERAVRGTLVNTAFARAFETIAPRERQNFAEFSARWCESLEREIAQRLGEVKEKKVA